VKPEDALYSLTGVEKVTKKLDFFILFFFLPIVTNQGVYNTLPPYTNNVL
jgi:hypothetical protein